MKGPGAFPNPTVQPDPLPSEGYQPGERLEMLPEGTIVKIIRHEPPFVRVETTETGRVCLVRECDLRSLPPLQILADQAE